MVAILLGADNGFFYAGQIMHFSSPFTVFLIYHKHTVLPTSQMVERFVKNGINCEISERTTHYLCNDAYYRMLRKTNGKAMSVHIPGSRYMTDELMAGIVKSLGE